MNVVPRHNKYFLYLLFCIAIAGLVLASLWLSGLYWLSHTIASKQVEIQKMLDEQLGVRIAMRRMKTHIHITGISLALKNVVVSDPKKAVPFVKMQKIELYPDMLQSILNKTIVLKKIQLDGLRLQLIWDDRTEKFRFVGLNGESLPVGERGEGEYQSILSSFAPDLSVSLSDAEIVWQGKKIEAVQRLAGELSWVSPEAKSFQFTGTQALKINEGDFFKVAPLSFHYDGTTGGFRVESGLANAIIRCQYDPNTGIDCDINANHLDLASLHQDLILHESGPPWIRWVLTSIPKGYLDGRVKIKGPLQHLDWYGGLRYRKLTLHYAPNWPAIEHAAGSIRLEKQAISIDMNRGEIVGTPIEEATAVIAPLGAESPATVAVAGSLSGDLENGLEFLKKSPLEKIYKTLATVNPKGGMDLNLDLNIPLSDKPSLVKGILKIKQGHLFIKECNLPIEQMNGTFEFTEKGLNTTEPVQALFLKRPMLIRSGVQGITAETYLTADFIQKQLPAAPLQYFEGGANITLLLPPDETIWVIKSDLKGVGIHLPSPLHKNAEEAWPMSLEIQHVSEAETRFVLQAPKVMDAKWKMGIAKKKLALKSAHIVLGQGASDWSTQNMILINGTISNLDVGDWQKFVEAETEAGGLKLPVSLHVLVGYLEAFGIEFTRTWIKFDSRQPHVWNLEGPLLKGHIHLPTSDKTGLLVDLEYLNLAPNENAKQKLAKNFLDTGERTPIIFGCKTLNYEGRHLGQVDFHLDPIKTGYAIRTFTAKARDFSLEGQGEWRTSDRHNITLLRGQLLSDNMGSALNRIGFASIEEGNGRIRYDFQWNDTPFDFEMKKVQGAATFQIKNGAILGFDPGLGKVVGLLSLDSIQRRLQLNFNDVVKKGFAFDTMRASLKFQQSMATTDDFMIDGPTAKIGLAGQVNLASKGLNLNMRVTPKIMSSSLPIAASIATGNPAVGVGVWMVDKLTGSKLWNLAQYDYQITGTWDSPNMQEVRRLGPNRQDKPTRHRHRHAK